MPGLYSHTTRANGLTLTAAIYNADHENHITNAVPAMHDDYSTNAAEMQTTTDPGEVGSESLATTLAGELERLRYAILDIKQKLDGSIAQWYQTPLSGFPVDNTGRPPLPAWHIDGLEISVYPSTPRVVNVATGWCRSADDKHNLKISTPMNRGITAVWASYVASGGGLVGAAVSNKRTCNIFVFKTAVSTFDIGGDVGLEASGLMAAASVAATDFHYRRIGSIIITNVSGTAIPVHQHDRYFSYTNLDYSDIDYYVQVTSDPVGQTIGVLAIKSTTGLPLVPTGINVRAHMLVYATGGSLARSAIFDGTKLNIPNAQAEFMRGPNASAAAYEVNVWTTTDGTVIVEKQVTIAPAVIEFAVLGYTDPARLK